MTTDTTPPTSCPACGAPISWQSSAMFLPKVRIDFECGYVWGNKDGDLWDEKQDCTRAFYAAVQLRAELKRADELIAAMSPDPRETEQLRSELNKANADCYGLTRVCEVLRQQLEQAASEVDASNERARQAEAKTDYYAGMVKEHAAQLEQAMALLDAHGMDTVSGRRFIERLTFSLDYCDQVSNAFANEQIDHLWTKAQLTEAKDALEQAMARNQYMADELILIRDILRGAQVEIDDEDSVANGVSVLASCDMEETKRADMWYGEYMTKSALLEDAEARIKLANQAFITHGYFSEDELGDDIAPRITEILSHYDTEMRELRAQAAPAQSVTSLPDVVREVVELAVWWRQGVSKHSNVNWMGVNNLTVAVDRYNEWVAAGNSLDALTHVSDAPAQGWRLLDAARKTLDYWKRNGFGNFQSEKMDDYMRMIEQALDDEQDDSRRVALAAQGEGK